MRKVLSPIPTPETSYNCSSEQRFSTNEIKEKCKEKREKIAK